MRWPTWARLSDAERARLEDLVRVFLVETRWEAAQGFTLTDEMRVVIAAQACLLVLELDLDLYRKADSVIVHPRSMVMRGERSVGSGLVTDRPRVVQGQAHHHAGPILLSWSTTAYEARHDTLGTNVVYHEFAHKIDMADGVLDGMPPLRDRAARERWITVCTAEFDTLRRGRPSVLREYAATDVGEFFAVATEQFFSQPAQLRDGNRDLYGVLSEFYRQDPARRFG